VLQAPLQKIDLQRLLTNFALQLRNVRLLPPSLALAWKRIGGAVMEFSPPTMEDIRIDFEGTRNLSRGRPLLKLLDGSQL